MILRHFLLMYNRISGDVVVAQEFGDALEAAEAYAELEREHRYAADIEIVLVGSDSLETIKRTHGNYFGDGVELPFRELVS